MKRRIAMLLSAALVASIVMLAPTSPASAHVDLCAGQGLATTGPLVYPTVDPNPRTTGFFFSFSGVGTCVVKTNLTATGTLTGWCGHSIGRGRTNNGHDFVWTSEGTTLTLTGGVVGEVNAIPNVLTNQSCITGATEFLVTGAVALAAHCDTKTKTTTQPRTENGVVVPGTNAKVCTTVSP